MPSETKPYSDPVVGLPQAGIGFLQAVPAGTTNGTQLSTDARLAGAVGVELCLKSGDAVTFCYYDATKTPPTIAPTYTHTVTGEREVSMFFRSGIGVLITSKTGNPTWRWM